MITWVGKPSRFLAELTPEAVVARAAGRFEALKAWRLERARPDDVPAYVVFHNSTLEEIAGRRPRSLAELASVPGVGPAKLERYGEDVLAALAAEQEVEQSFGSRRRRSRRGGGAVRGRAARVAELTRRPSRISCSSTAPSRPANVV